MTRKMKTIITGKTIIYFKLELKTNLYIGSGESNIDTDALCIRNSEGNLMVPGTTLAGVFRSNLEKLFGEKEKLITDLFGKVEVNKSNVDSFASNIIFQDAVIQTNKEVNTDIRDGIKINREYQSTEEGAKYDKETVFKGSVFQGIITITQTNKNKNDFSKYLGLVKIIFYNLNEGLISIGGSSSRGLGLCSIKECIICELDFTNLTHFNDFLLDDFYDFEKTKNEHQNYLKDLDFKIPLSDLQPINNNYIIKIDYIISTIEPLLINGPRTNDEEVDFYFIKTNNEYFIPGSSFKGPIRNRAEMILETMDVKEAETAINKLFGSVEQKSKVQFHDLFPESELKIKYFDHNKIDRFTGGTMVNALFSEKLIFKGKFHGRIIIVKISWGEIKLLMQIFKDLYLGDIRIGYGKTKGYGKIKGKIINLRIYKINKSMIENKDLTEYNFEFSKKENIYQICEIIDLYSKNNKEKYEEFFKLIEESNYA